MRTPCFAHSLEDAPTTEWHRLETHLADTAERAEEFASSFAPGWGRLAGLWHDAGKYQDEFQRYIGVDSYCEEVKGRVDHSSVGAIIASRKGAHGKPLAMVIAGHHTGLKSLTELKGRLAKHEHRVESARAGGLPSELEKGSLPPPPTWVADPITAAMWTRFLFSALVDADFLDTEAFYEGRERAGQVHSLGGLLDNLESYLERFDGAPVTDVNEMRRRVLFDCRRKAAQGPGVFSLTVPTGGGKTLSSLVFALHHAVRHGLRRIIVVIPYMSILEQTAATYRRAVGSDDAVLEHHSNVRVRPSPVLWLT